MAGECRRPRVFQFHGFGAATQSGAGCGFNFILADGVATRAGDPPHLVALGNALANHSLDGAGVTAYTWNIASSGANDCSALTATQNQQGAATRAAGGLFYHLESDDTIRAWPDAADALEVTLALGEGSLWGPRLSAAKGAGGAVTLAWLPEFGGEKLYRFPALPPQCGVATATSVNGGAFTDPAAPGSAFYRVE